MKLSKDPDNVTKTKLTSAILTWTKRMENPNNITKNKVDLSPSHNIDIFTSQINISASYKLIHK